MYKGFRILLVLVLTICFALPVLSQGQGRDPRSQYNPLKLVQRLSYENFRNIKLLQSALLNYGNGMKDIDLLVNEYAEASALYFQDKIPLAATKFSENQRHILEAAKKLVLIYRKKVNKMVTGVIKYNTRQIIIMSLDGRKRKTTPDKYVRNAGFAYKKANDYVDRYINAKYANPKQLAHAIYYYRRSKENIFIAYKAYIQMGTNYKKLLRLEKKNKLTAKQKKEINQKRFLIKKLAGYEKDMVDNSNKQFKSKDKRN